MPVSHNNALRLAGNAFATIFIGFGVNALLRPEHALTFFEWKPPTALSDRQLVESLVHLYGIRDIFMGLVMYAASFCGTRQSFGWTVLAASAVAYGDGLVCRAWGMGEWNHWGYAPMLTVVGAALVGAFDWA
ncbi:integral membrane protein [Aspergillus sp. HF37]|nr:integral membrane protein [Aspergillus sp. HF37]